MADGGAYARKELTRAEGLGYVVVSSEIESLDLVSLMRPRRDNDDGQKRPLAHTFNDLKPVNIRQAEIENDEIRAM